ncbi:sulfite exporter TauE/SafE family protein [Psychrosphaera aestuarii]|uniref:sulfite exporter TauE/SafE family protein n=1 Tax=Psychrosphaera aestuarii TaxID=1266052 RepID=UPI001B33A6F7|nr:sulfite exporter TauE/SafE family protein [Psychrosphaera aestuarii]
MTDLLIFTPLLGIVAGFLSGLLGIGGGIVIIPVLLYLLPQLPQVNDSNVAIISIATSLFTICITAFSSGRSHYKNGNVNWAITKPVVLTVGISAIVASQIAVQLSSAWLTKIFAVLLMVLALLMWRGKHDIADDKYNVSRVKLGFGGILTGTLASMAGLGGGAILVPYMTFIGVHVRQAIATAAIAGVVVAVFGTLGYLWAGWKWTSSADFLGYVHWPTALMIMAFSYFSAPWGVKAGQKLQQAQLKKVFAVFMMLVSIKLLLEVLQVW